jgi:hypothetical protein
MTEEAGSMSQKASGPRLDVYGEYDENGVDVSLLRYMLSLSPLQRLEVMEKCARDTRVLYEWSRKHREAESPQDR